MARVQGIEKKNVPLRTFADRNFFKLKNQKVFFVEMHKVLSECTLRVVKLFTFAVRQKKICATFLLCKSAESHESSSNLKS